MNVKTVFGRWFDTKTYFWLYAALLVNGGLMLYTSHVTFRTFPLSPDEYSDQISAELFASGKLSVPSPEPRAFFDLHNVVNNGTFYGKYPPGWPLLLALGKKLGVEWEVNPLLGLLALVLLFLMARTFFSPPAANVAMALTFFCPYFIFNSACLMSHPSGLLCLTLAAYFLLVPDFGLESALGLGMTGGYAFLIRPFTTVLFLAPLVLCAIVPAIRQRDKRTFMNLFLVTLPVFMTFVALFLFYNYAQTGHAFLQPYQVYNPQEHLGFDTHTWSEYWRRLEQNILKRMFALVSWTAGIPLAVLWYWVKTRSQGPNERKGILFITPALCLLIGYFFYAGSGVTQFGPRYLYESYALLLIPAALGVLTTKRWIPWVVALFMVLNLSKFIVETDISQKTYRDETRVFRTFQRLSNAVVFVQDPKFPGFFIRNGLDFNGPVLLVKDLGAENNQEIIRRFPGRSFYLFNPTIQDWDHVLKPYVEEAARKVPDQEDWQGLSSP